MKGQERTFDMLHALRKKLWENGVRDQVRAASVCSDCAVQPSDIACCSESQACHPVVEPRPNHDQQI